MIRRAGAVAAVFVLGVASAALFGTLAGRQSAAQTLGLRRTSASTLYAQQLKKGTKLEKATFGAGCFWGVEAAFRGVKGVTATRVGYAGGHTRNPSYHDVCAGDTGHAEVVEVTFDPAAVTYDELLKVFWREHDPTTPNRQGPDVGYQYRSVIFYHSAAQKQAAEASKTTLGESGLHRNPIVTAIEPAGDFWQAEDYHQQYLEKRGLAACRVR